MAYTCQHCHKPVGKRTIVCPHCHALVWHPHLVVLGDLGGVVDAARAAQRQRVTK